jgi:transcription elongation GreA/GreB family factor
MLVQRARADIRFTLTGKKLGRNQSVRGFLLSHGTAPDRAGLGARVVPEDLATGDKVDYDITCSDHIDLHPSRIPMASAIGRALPGHQLGDEVVVRLPSGDRTYLVIDLATLPQMVS